MFSALMRSSQFGRLASVSAVRPFCALAPSVKPNPVQPVARPDRLFRKIELEVRGNDRQVIQSYIEFARMAAENLSLDFYGAYYKGENFITKFKYHVERQICLRSAFVHKKHREQYEWRTYVLLCRLSHLTESTADTFLEYIERNLPEGCSLIVHKYEAVKMLDHLQPPTDEPDSSEQPNVSSESNPKKV